jgi:hypothetical protein
MPVNERDAFLRHQAYLEGYKNGVADQNDSLAEEIAAIVILLLARLGVDKLSELNRRNLNKFVAETNRKVGEVFGKQTAFTVDTFRKFLKTELRVSAGLFGALEGFDTVPPLNPDRIIAEAVNAPIAGLGDTVPVVLQGIAATVLAELRKQFMRDAADNATVAETTRAIVGTKAKRGLDGVIGKALRRGTSALETAIQHGSSFLNYRLGSLVADRYQWVSVLDKGTTDICRSRNGNIYTYGDGPRPPAHYRCRSTIVPVTETAPGPVPTYFAWLKRQPSEILIDLLGVTRANAFERGNLSAEELGPFGGARSLTLTEYAAKLPRMIGN